MHLAMKHTEYLKEDNVYTCLNWVFTRVTFPECFSDLKYDQK
jgi:hypothetical protein